MKTEKVMVAAAAILGLWASTAWTQEAAPRPRPEPSDGSRRDAEHRRAEEERRRVEERKRVEEKRAEEAERAKERRQETEVKRVEEKERQAKRVHEMVRRHKDVEFKLHTKGAWGREERAYRRGQELLDARRWEQAIEAFDEALEPEDPQPPLVPRKPGAPALPAPPAPPARRADAALYWKAYAQHKLGHRDEALSTLGVLKKEHSGSPWLSEAKVLEAEVRQAAGQAPSPESEVDDELKLMALNALLKSEPDRAVPLLEKILQGTGSPKLKERALFVLTQTGSPKAREIVARVARGPSNPDLQLIAARHVGFFGGPESVRLLVDVYRQATDRELKRTVVETLTRIEGGSAALPQLLEAEKDPEISAELIHALARTGSKESLERFRGLYGASKEARIKREVLEALCRHGDAAGLVALARQEKDPEMKKEIVARLSMMKKPEATEYLLEILAK